MSVKAKIEAVLFSTDKPIHAAAIARLVNEDVQLVRQTLLELIHDYEERQGALEIAQDNGYMIQVKDEYSSVINEFLPIEMSAALLRTLSAIAIKQPVMQSEIVRVRGAGAYDHIKELLIRELINKKDEGRSPVLTTTKKFQEYFRLTKDARSLRQTIKKQEAAKSAEEGAGEGEGQLGLPLAGAAEGDAAATGDSSEVEYDTAIERLLDMAIDVGPEEEATASSTSTETSTETVNEASSEIVDETTTETTTESEFRPSESETGAVAPPTREEGASLSGPYGL